MKKAMVFLKRRFALSMAVLMCISSFPDAAFAAQISVEEVQESMEQTDAAKAEAELAAEAQSEADQDKTTQADKVQAEAAQAADAQADVPKMDEVQTVADQTVDAQADVPKMDELQAETAQIVDAQADVPKMDEAQAVADQTADTQNQAAQSDEDETVALLDDESDYGITYRLSGTTLYVTGTGEISANSWEDGDPAAVESLVIGEGITSIGSSAFSNWDGRGYCYLRTVSLPDTLLEIGDYAFDECSNLVQINIPDSVLSIGDGAFYNSGLIAASIGKGVTEIPWDCFADCYILSSVAMNGKVTTIGECAFQGCTFLTEINLPSTITSIEWEAFQDCSSLESITLPESLVYIGSRAFDNCEKLTSITIPAKVTAIYARAFNQCVSLSKVSFASGCKVTEIGGHVFDSCTSLKSFTLPATVTSYRASFQNSGLTSFAVASGGHFIYTNGMLYSADGKTILECFRKTPTSLYIPSGVTKIAYAAFCGCSALTSVGLPKTVTSIDDRAFCDASNITNVYTGLTKTVFESYSLNYRFWNEDCVFHYSSSLPGVTVTTPALKSISNAAAGITVTWTPQANADYYYIFRKASGAASWSKVGTAKYTESSFIDTTAASGTTYSYTVRAYTGSTASGYNTTGLKYLRLSQPSVTLSNVAGGINVKWGKVTGAAKYYIYRRNVGGSWGKLTEVSSSVTSYKDTTAAAGTIYFYTVRAVNGSYASSFDSTKYLCRITAPTLKSAVSGVGKITLTWGKVTGAKGYYIFRKNVGATSWTRIATVASATTLTYSDTAVTNGAGYVYTVRGYSGSSLGNYSSTGITSYYLTQPAAPTAVSSKTGTFTISMTKNAKATGYQVYYSTDSKMQTGLKAASISQYYSTWTISGLTSGTKYYYKVRSYILVNGVKYYSAWSSAASITAK